MYHKNLPLVKAYVILLTSMHIIFTIFANIMCPIIFFFYVAKTFRKKEFEKKKKGDSKLFMAKLFDEVIKLLLILK